MAPPAQIGHINNGDSPLNGGVAIRVVTKETALPPGLSSAGLLDADEFRRHGHQVIDFIADYYAGMGSYPVRPSVTPGFLRDKLPTEAPQRPDEREDAFAAALRDVRDHVLPGLTHWQSPRHFAHFAASSSTAGALGEALAAGINVVPFTWAASPAATELEMVVTDWLGKAMHLPESLLFSGGGGGTLLGTSCEAILCALVAARERKLAEVGSRRIGDLVVYCSDQTHFALRKAARIAGITATTAAKSPPAATACSRSRRRTCVPPWTPTWTPGWSRCSSAPRSAPPRPPPWTQSGSSATSRRRSAPGSTWTRRRVGARLPGVPPRHRRRRRRRRRGLLQHERPQVAPGQH
jgi:tyrosine decarboxylase